MVNSSCAIRKRADIAAVVVLPWSVRFINTCADENAPIIWLVFRLNQPLPFVLEL